VHVLQRLRRSAPWRHLPELRRRSAPPPHAGVGQIGKFPCIDRARIQTCRLRDNGLNPLLQMPTGPGILDIHNLSFAYPDQPPLAVNWSTSISAGITVLYGDTGSGKSTLIRVLAGVLPCAGQLTLAGKCLDDRESYRKTVFFCDPATDAFDQVTGRACTEQLNEDDAHFNQARWQALVDGFALASHLDKPMYMLSTGSKRKVWLAAALASGRPLILLDEPTGGLDAASTRCLWKTLTELASQPDHAIVMATGELIDQVPLVRAIELPLA